jgi:MFS family permease
MASLFFLSSRPITGVPPLRDWRLLVVACLLFAAFVLWEKGQPDPFIAASVFAHLPFTQASLCAAARMAGNGAISFLVPLYLADIRGLNAAGIGLAAVVHSAALAVGMRLGGRVADRVGSRPLVALGLTVQVLILVYFALLSGAAWLALVNLGLVVHGLGAGLAQPALDRAAMGQIPRERTGAAAGLYSMIRFAGSMVGITLMGVLLQNGLDRGLAPLNAYHLVFACVAGLVTMGVVVGLRLRV